MQKLAQQGYQVKLFSVCIDLYSSVECWVRTLLKKNFHTQVYEVYEQITNDILSLAVLNLKV